MIITEKEGLTTPGEWDSLASQLLMGVMCPTLLLRVIRTILPKNSPSRDSELVSRGSRNCVQDKEVHNSITKVGESHAMRDDNQNYTGSSRRPLVEGKNLIIRGTRSRWRQADRQTDRGVLRGIMGEQTFYVSFSHECPRVRSRGDPSSGGFSWVWPVGDDRAHLFPTPPSVISARA